MYPVPYGRCVDIASWKGFAAERRWRRLGGVLVLLGLCIWLTTLVGAFRGWFRQMCWVDGFLFMVSVYRFG